ncbi:MAG: ABC transporter substrate-binding protein [Planctomycetota bacterium]
MMLRTSLVALACFSLTLACGGGGASDGAVGAKTLRLPMRSAGPGTLDPVMGSTTYDNRAASMSYETLLQYKYLARPLELEPLLVTEMPKVTERDGQQVYRFTLRDDVRFQDDPCFEGGVGRPLVASDVIYSWKRLADPVNEYKSWWIVADMIVGLDAYKEAQKARVDAGESFDYEAEVEGLRVLNEREFEVVLTEPVYAFLYKITQFQLSIVPREAVETYGEQFAIRPVGTGPYVLAKDGWTKNKSLSYLRNPNFHPEVYPTAHEAGDEEFGLHVAAGQTLPFADRVEFTMFENDNPMWLEFKAGGLDYSQVPAENFAEAFELRSRRLKAEFRDKGVRGTSVPLLDFIFRAFNMEDELVGGTTDDKIALRRAFALATNLKEFNDSFYNGQNIVYDGMIPPGLDGHPEGGLSAVSVRGPQLDEARRLLAEAGYPGGEGLPVIDYYISSGSNIPEQASMWKRQLGALGVQLNVRQSNFAQLIDAVNSKKAPMFSFSWSSDYPDGENNLSLFYSPNVSPGSNHFNYSRPEFDELYEKVRAMPPSPERTRLYEEMRDIVLADVPFVGSMARERFYVIQPSLKNFKPTEAFYNWVKYLDVAARP